MEMNQESEEPIAPGKGIIARDPQKPGESRANLVKEWQDKVLRAKKHWKNFHDKMRQDVDFYMGKQWPGQGEDDERYVANIVQSHIGRRVAALYAKNPKFVAKRRETLDFSVWDGDMASLQNAQTSMTAAAQGMAPMDPVMIQTLQDVQQGMERRRMLDRVAKTMEIVSHHQIAEQQPPFKSQMKQLVRRVCVTGVGFVKLGYHRMMEKRPEDVEKITDITEQLATLERLVADKADEKFEETSARVEQLRLMLMELQNKQDIIVREGLVFDFPLSSSIIPDSKCRQINGFVGADWVAQEFVLDAEEVKEIYKVDLGKEYTPYDTDGLPSDKDDKDRRVVVWEIYSKKDGLCYVVADGFHDFLRAPAAPEIRLERFWPFFVLAFNEVESDRDIFPPSDVRLLMPVQREYNRARQGLREQRHANRPKYVTYTGALSESDIKNLQTSPANAVIQLQNLSPGQAVNGVLQPVQHSPIDPSLYDTGMLLDDMMRVVGSQEANIGGTSASTATEVSVAEGSRMSGLASNIDDLDDFLSEIARAVGQVLLKEMDQETVMKLAGPGAVWPQLTCNEIAEELFLEVEAGSNGRPNKAMQIQNFERLAPILLQIPGMNPEFLAKIAIERLDDGLDVKDAIRAALPSIIAMNAISSLGPQVQPATGDPSTDPAMQGGMGAQNAPVAALPVGTNGPTTVTPGQIRSGNMPPLS